MKSPQLRIAALVVVSILATAWPGRTEEVPVRYQEVMQILDRKGDFKDNVFKIGIPRSDLTVTVHGVDTPTPFGFGGWIAMTPGNGGHEVMMGDLVLLEDEVNPVMSALLDNGLEVTALHNHFFWEQPRLFYMHVHGHGEAADLARQVKPALALITKAGHPAAPQTSTLNTAQLSQIIGTPGEASGIVYKVTIGRPDVHLKEMGATINSRMGFNSWAAFVGTDDHAAIAGDVAMLEGEVTPVLKALRQNGLDVVAIHHHMTGTRPMIIFLHYWGQGPAVKLATGFRAALDALGTKRVR